MVFFDDDKIKAQISMMLRRDEYKSQEEAMTAVMKWYREYLKEMLEAVGNEADDCMTALGYWDDKEFVGNPKNHKLKDMRPMNITKAFLRKVKNTSF